MKFYGQFPTRVSAAEKRALAKRAASRIPGAQPVAIEGRKITTTFWGNAWCEHLERYSDYASRLPRGRAYVRSGAVIDLRVTRGRVVAVVQGSSTYDVAIEVTPLTASLWQSVVKKCTGQIASVVELLRGEMSDAVMKVVTDPLSGLFPAPQQIALSCSCPDSARMCKHVAAVLYGVGARLDGSPELLFTLRDVDALDLVARAASSLGTRAPAKAPAVGGDLGALFGIELEDEDAVAPAPAAAPTKPARGRAEKKPAAPRGPVKVTRKELTALGVPGPTISAWLETGLLLKTDERGVYKHTPHSRAKAAGYAKRGA